MLVTIVFGHRSMDFRVSLFKTKQARAIDARACFFLMNRMDDEIQEEQYRNDI
jgi:hypothetical protein